MNPEAFTAIMCRALASFPLYHPSQNVISVISGDAIRGHYEGTAKLVLYASPAVIHIADIVIPESERHQGLGRLLLGVAERVGKEWGCSQVHLISKNADGFYRKCGYQEVPFPRHVAITDLLVPLPFFMKDISQRWTSTTLKNNQRILDKGE